MPDADNVAVPTFTAPPLRGGTQQPGIFVGAAGGSRATVSVGTAILVTLIGFLSVAFFFRYQILSRFTLLSGNRYDQVIEVSVLEHWFNVFRGVARWSETGYFYPIKKTLGYNDGYFLYGVIYSVFRGVRLDPYLSGECVNIVMRLVAFFGFYLAARRVLDFRPGWAILGAVLFTLSNNLSLQAHHAQLLGVAFAPVMAVLLHGLWTALVSGRRLHVVVWGASAACLYAAWLMTAYYTAWYFSFFGTFLCASYAILGGRAGLEPIWKAVRRHELSLAIILLILFLASLPFLSIYLPKAHETGMHPYRGVQIYTLSIPDLLEVGRGNLMFGRIVAFVDHVLRPSYPAWSERMTGFPPVLLFFFACGVAVLLAVPRTPVPGRTPLLRALAVATVATWVLAFNVDGHSLWWFIYKGFPGAGAARVVARYQVFLAGPVIAVAVFYLSASARGATVPVLLVACALLVAEEVNTGALVALDRPHELAYLNSVPPPPAGCKAFFTSSARPETVLDEPDLEDFYNHNVDAMIIAEMTHLPTINGASTFHPPNWDLVAPGRSDYLERVRRYAVANGVTQLCGLDLKTMKWSRMQVASGS